jgi:hypothetical protein
MLEKFTDAYTHKNTAPKQTPKNSDSAQQNLDFSCDEIPRIFLHQSARDRERISVELAHKTQKSRRKQQKRESCGVISAAPFSTSFFGVPILPSYPCPVGA